MIDVLDVHTHTIVSGHAYSTIREMARAAKKKGLEVLGITEHGPRMPGSCHKMYFQNMRILDRNAYDVDILFAVELNVLDEAGRVDLAEEELKAMDIVIASMHTPCMAPLSKNGNTWAILHVMENPYVNIIGHLDDSRFPVDYETIVKEAKRCHELLELNNSSLLPTSFRPNAKENNEKLLKQCKKYEVPIVINSDAHVDTSVGEHEMAKKLLQEVDFPETLIVNRSYDELKKYINRFQSSL